MTSLRWSVLLVTVLAGCAVGPDYEQPEIELAESFVSGAFAAQDPVAEPDRAWWKTFGDPLLVELIDAGMADNLTVEQARARIRRARAVQRIAAGARYPSVGTRGAYARQRASENGPANLGELADRGLAELETGVFTLDIDASWEVDVFGSVRRRNEAAAERLLAAEEEERLVRVSVIAEIASVYVELRGAERRLAIAKKNIDVQSQTLDLVASKVRIGLSRSIDVERARGQLRAVEATLPRLRAAVRSATFRLAVLTGQMPGALDRRLSASSSLRLRGEPIPIGLPTTLLRRRADVRLAERRLRAAVADVGVATADLYPRFFLNGAAGLESIDASDFARRSSGRFSIGPSVSWPIFQGGALRARVDGAKAGVDEAVAGFRESVLLAVEDVERALVRYGEETNARARLRDSRDATDRAADLARNLYRSGLVDFLDVLDAERRAFEADDAVVVSEIAVARWLVALYKALGGGWAG